MVEKGVTAQFEGWNIANGGLGACGIHRSMDWRWCLGEGSVLKLVFYCNARDNPENWVSGNRECGESTEVPTLNL